jgi:ribosomal protein S12 methylthiotransferase RimO
MAATPSGARRVALVTLGCARNEVDSEELAGRLASSGWELVADPAEADVAVVNTCGFVEQAKKDSIDAVLEAADLKENGRTRAVVAVGCLAERYGATLAEELPEADAVLGFDRYADLSDHLRAVLDGHPPAAHAPTDRRTLLPLTPVDRAVPASTLAVPGHGWSPAATDPDVPAGVPASGPVIRTRLADAPWAPLKIASGCDRRCAFCAIPMFRGSFVSRRPGDVLAEARWLAERGVRELLLVSENSTSYGKDLGDLRLLEALLPDLAAVDGIERVRVSYLQPAEVRPSLIDVMTSTPGVMPYFDLSFQHAAPGLLRRMRRFGGTESFLGLLDDIRRRVPDAGVRSNVIVGFPGETGADIAELEAFLAAARLDVVGVFGYSDEDGTEAARLDGALAPDEVAARAARIGDLVEELTAQRAADRVGSRVRVLVEEVDEGAGEVVGRAEHQGPEVDGATILSLGGPGGRRPVPPIMGMFVDAVVVGTEGIDLVAAVTGDQVGAP